MAEQKTPEVKEVSVEARLKALYDLQRVVSEIDKIKTLRGELPLEVQDLEDEIAGLQTRIEKYHNDIVDLRKRIEAEKIKIEESRAKIEKNTEQQKKRIERNRSRNQTRRRAFARKSARPRRKNRATLADGFQTHPQKCT